MGVKGIKALWGIRPVQQLGVVLLTVALVWASLAASGRQVVLAVDGKTLRYSTLQPSVKGVLAEAGVTLGPRDQVSPGLETGIRNNLKICVVRGVMVSVEADGRLKRVVVSPSTVAGALRETGVRLNPLDRVNLPLQQRVREGDRIRVTRVVERTTKERFEIPAAEEQRPDPGLERGRVRVLQAGLPGEGERFIKEVYLDGRLADRQVIQELLIRPAVKRIVAVGTMNIVYRGGEVLGFRRVLVARATAYSAGAGARTATGSPLHYGVVATDPSVIPMGTRLYVEGYGYATALDRGSAIVGNRLDLFFPTREEALRWGSRMVKVYVLD